MSWYRFVNVWLWNWKFCVNLIVNLTINLKTKQRLWQIANAHRCLFVKNCSPHFDISCDHLEWWFCFVKLRLIGSDWPNRKQWTKHWKQQSISFYRSIILIDGRPKVALKVKNDQSSIKINRLLFVLALDEFNKGPNRLQPKHKNSRRVNCSIESSWINEIESIFLWVSLKSIIATDSYNCLKKKP